MTLRSPMRIAFLTHSVLPRGGVVHTLELARALHDAGHRVTVYAPATAGQRLFRQVPFAVELVPVPSPPTADVAAMVECRIAAFERHLSAQPVTLASVDIFHAQDPIGANALANLQDRGAIRGFVRTVHHLDDFADARLTAWQRRGFERAGQVFCVSGLWQETLRQPPYGIDAALVWNGVDCERYGRTGGSPTGPHSDVAMLAGLGHGLRAGAAAAEPVFLAVGGVEERKNTLRILQAFLIARSRWPRAQLVIAGGASLLDHDRYAQAFHAAARAAGLKAGRDGPLLLTGPLPDEAMPSLMRRADALLMPSLREGFGLVVLEALACGTPVVVSRMAPFTEYLGDADCCWADPHDAGSIAEAMAAALDPERNQALARRVPDVCRRYDWGASATRHVELYRSFARSAAPLPLPSAPFDKDPRHARHALPSALAGCQ